MEKTKPSLLQRIPPALMLWLAAPAFGELLSGSAPLNEYANPIVFIILTILYGPGALMARELIVRWKKGWGSLLLLGMTYGIYEEGLVVRSFFNPGWEDLGSMAHYGRLWGANWIWIEHLTIYHAVISICASVTFVEILYPDRRKESWLQGCKWWSLNLVPFLLMLPIGTLIAPYRVHPGWILLTWFSIGLIILAARLIPANILKTRQVKVPHPRRFYLAGLLGYFIYTFLLYLGSDENRYPALVTAILLVAVSLFVLWLVLRWSGNGGAWDDRHRLALIFGGLSFYVIIFVMMLRDSYPITTWTNPLYLLLFWLIYHHIAQREQTEHPKTEECPALMPRANAQ
ncbi:MAG: hypothetical protein JXA13_00740 [Anaerolineales bacterium]|nr:hypothetical protein [Anaerolineales bacterium]